MFKSKYFVTDDNLVKFLNTTNIEIISITKAEGINSGYMLFYKEKK